MYARKTLALAALVVAALLSNVAPASAQFQIGFKFDRKDRFDRFDKFDRFNRFDRFDFDKFRDFNRFGRRNLFLFCGRVFDSNRDFRRSLNGLSFSKRLALIELSQLVSQRTSQIEFAARTGNFRLARVRARQLQQVLVQLDFAVGRLSFRGNGFFVKRIYSGLERDIRDLIRIAG